ncbi:MAG: hypothetical protein A2Y48_03185 [Nitrospirae bacterium RIFCSPLOW2_12_42_9]|nr:MAG: hypothetical protein A2Y48_03185 [Nitrospirae bacterium RIFCSPLOW2_12_42_9]OGW57957.1 MAG: hypothetical protein A3D21_04115 [Nitrospirae bacterium RIFCSPHIGHO2_02_FULL_42_12]
MYKRCCLLLIVPLILFTFISTARGGEEGPLELITAQEAATPDMDPSQLHVEVGREDGNGPIIELIAPEMGSPLKPPVPISIKFVKRAEKEIDTATFKLEYLKFITIDLTSKVKQYVTKEGIKVPEAKLPSGTHTIRLSIGDITGALTKRILTIEVL